MAGADHRGGEFLFQLSMTVARRYMNRESRVPTWTGKS
jgi:hypothetical protein